MRSWVLRNNLKFVGNESHENIPEGLRIGLGCIHNLQCTYKCCIDVRPDFSHKDRICPTMIIYNSNMCFNSQN
jgi:hypothetical protein